MVQLLWKCLKGNHQKRVAAAQVISEAQVSKLTGRPVDEAAYGFRMAGWAVAIAGQFLSFSRYLMQ